MVRADTLTLAVLQKISKADCAAPADISLVANLPSDSKSKP